MRPNLFALFAPLALALSLVGCGGGGSSTGGGGGGGGGGGTGGQAPPAGQYLEFVGVSRSGFLDPLNLQVGDVVNVEAVNYDPAGTRTVLKGTNWATTADPSQATVNSGGRLTVNAKPPGVFRVSARATVSGQVRTLAQDAIVATVGATTFTGTVRADGTANGIVYVQVEFYNGNGERVAGARTGDAGKFFANVPNTVKTISIKGESVPSGFFRSIRFGNDVYTMDDPSCAVPTGALKVGQNNSLPAPLFVPPSSGGPPPPPSGCLNN